MKYLKIEKARYVGSLKVELTFNDGVVVVIDFGSWIQMNPHPQYNRYLDEKKFKPRTIQYEISAAKNKMISAEYYLAQAGTDYVKGIYGKVYKRYSEKLLQNNAATQKQVDDLSDKIAILKAQISAQKQSWERGNSNINSEMSVYEIQLAEKEDHDIRTGLFLLAVETGRKNLCVVEDKSVTLSEVFNDIFKDTMLDFSCLPVEYQ